ncbi:MAG: HAMP domain-containing histidine kinase [Bacteroidaceae bacterium]|nr:HAMP domain-containing histidine kinase [Bacteroidaceae bacterium]
MKQYIITLTLIILSSFPAFSQNGRGDAAIKKHMDSLFIRCYDSIATPNASRYIQQYYNESEKLQLKKDMAEADNFSIYYIGIIKAQPEKALAMYNRMKQTYPDCHTQLDKARFNVINAFWHNCKPLFAIQECQKIITQDPNPKNVTKAYLVLAQVYLMNHFDNTKAAEVAEQAIHHITTIDKKYQNAYLAELTCIAALAHAKKQDITKAKKHLSTVDSLYIIYGDKSILPIMAVFNKVELYMAHFYYELAKYKYDTALSYAEKIKDANTPGSYKNYLILLTDYYIHRAEYQKALKTLQIIEQEQDIPQTQILNIEIKLKKVEIFKALQHYKEALEITQSVATLIDSLQFHQTAYEIDKYNQQIQQDQTNVTELQNLQASKKRTDGIFATLLFFAFLVLVIGFAYWLHQMSETKTELAEALSRTKKLSQVKTTFIQNITHEMRTPMNAIFGFAQLIEDECKGNPILEEYVKYIADNTSAMTKIVNDTILVSSIESEDPKLNEFKIDEVCKKAIHTSLNHKQPQVQFNYQPQDTQLTIISDKDRVYALIENLVSNAVKFTKQGSITLQYQIQEPTLNQGRLTLNNLVITITDTGCGIPQDKHEFIFERFTKLDTFVQGTGLGLSVCRMVTETLGGSIKVDPTYTDGARFIAQIPIAKAEDTNLIKEHHYGAYRS